MMRQQSSRLVLAAVLVACCFVACDAIACYEKGGFSKSDWPYCFSAGSNVLAYSGKSGNDVMKLGMWVEGHTGGWSALAISGNGGMKGAREIVVRKNDSGTWVAEDRYSTAYALPVLTSSQDLKLISAAEANGGTAWSVMVPLNACKEDVDGLPSNYPLTEDIERSMLWALGDTHTFSYHGTTRRGTFYANLISGPRTPPNVAGMQSVALKMPNVRVEIGPQGTDESNPYVCSVFNLSKVLPGRNMSNKHHAVKFEVALNQTSAKFVHQIMMFSCNDQRVREAGFKHEQVFTDCEGMLKGCSGPAFDGVELKWSWAVGGVPLHMPADVGMPLGEGRTWVALQMQYHNPSRVTNVIDNSGVSLTLSSTPRPIDAGILQINGGSSPFQRLVMPKGKNKFSLDFFIPKDCTELWTEPFINVIGTNYHAHQFGKRLNIDVSRDGMYIGTVRRENYYDSTHQSYGEGMVKKIFKGDELSMTCSYNTVPATSDVEFGLLKENEMCWAALLYYPKDKNIDPEYIFAGEPIGRDGVICGGGHRSYTSITTPEYTVPACQRVGNLSRQGASHSPGSGDVTLPGGGGLPSPGSSPVTVPGGTPDVTLPGGGGSPSPATVDATSRASPEAYGSAFIVGMVIVKFTL